MNSQCNLLRKSLSILDSIHTLIIVAFIFSIFYDLALKNFGLGMNVIFIPLKILLYSGIFGTIIEIVAGEEMIPSFARIKDNAKRYWLMYALLMSIPLVIHFFVYSLIPLTGVTLNTIAAQVNILILCLLAFLMIKNKYIHPFHFKKKKITIPVNAFFVILFIYFLEIFFAYLPQFFETGRYHLPNIIGLMTMYLHFYGFLLLSVIVAAQYPQIEDQFFPKKEIYLINPVAGGIVQSIATQFLPIKTPAFVVLRALTPSDYKVREFTRVKWHNRFYKSNVLVALTCYTSNCYEAYKIAKEFKKRGAKVVIGGPHVTYLPEEALEFCDSVVIGAAEGIWEDIVKDYENSNLQQKYYGKTDEASYKKVHAQMLKAPPELIKDYLETTRGCKFRCDFCAIPSLSDGKVREKPVFEVVELMERIKHKYKNVLFIDNNIYSNPGYARELFKALKPLNMKWSTQCTIDIAKNEETLRLAKEAGCECFLIGYEIPQDSSEREQGGKFSLNEKYLQYSRKIKEQGIRIKAHFIFGFDSDNFWKILNFWKFCFLINPTITVVSLLTPLPGAKLFNDMMEEGRIINGNWREYSCQSLVFEHGTMNNALLTMAFPVIYVIFFFTTSKLGYSVLAGLLIIKWLVTLTV